MLNKIVSSNLNTGIIASLLSSLFLATATEIIHFYKVNDILSLLFVQNLVSFLMNISVIGTTVGISYTHFKVGYRLHLIRAILGIGTFLSYYKALSLVVPVNVVLIINFAPCLVPIINFIFLSHNIKVTSLLCIFIGFIGAYLILSPEIGNISATQGYLFAFISAVLFACSFIVIKELTQKVNYITVITLYNFHSIVFLLFFLDTSFLSTNYLIIYLIISLLFFLQNHCLTLSIHILGSKLSSTLSYLSIIIIAIIDYWFFNKTLTMTSMVGIGLIFLSQFSVFFLAKAD